ncbi:mCG1050365 [Mus musculus]|nr:mCG1050365 [Mus musculus]
MTGTARRAASTHKTAVATAPLTRSLSRALATGLTMARYRSKLRPVRQKTLAYMLTKMR